jgi:hypothetical protein
MFRATHRPSLRAQKLQLQPLVLHTFLVAGRCDRSCRQPNTYVKSEAAITVFELLMMGGVSLETCWAIKELWNNKFYYTVASCWFFLWDLYYDARIHEHHHFSSHVFVRHTLRFICLKIRDKRINYEAPQYASFNILSSSVTWIEILSSTICSQTPCEKKTKFHTHAR